jgi:hypothetical protein
MFTHTEVSLRLEDSLDTIRILAEVLVANGGCKGNADVAAQIDERGEEGIYKAILLLASASHRDFCQLATDLEIPQ